MDMSLAGKKALICGGSQGIGHAIAMELALLGADCILLSRNASNLETALRSLDTTKGQQHGYQAADLSDPGKAAEAVKEITASGPVHILINNSGGPAAGPVLDAQPDQFLQAFQQHLIANHILATGMIGGMKAAGYGRIINIISTSVKVPLKNLGVSNTIRGAVASWAKTMANELGAFGITVNNILPGATSTGRLEAIVQHTAARKGSTPSEVAVEMQHEIPARRFGTPEEIAAVAAFLATPAAAYVNGASIPVDGGRTGSI